MSGQQDYSAELTSLAEFAGISAPPAVFRIINELLAMHVAPEDIHRLLRSICPLSTRKEDSGGKSGGTNH